MPRTSVFFERAELAPPTRRVPVRTFVLRPGSRFAAPGTHALHVVPRPPRSPASPPAKFRLLRVRLMLRLHLQRVARHNDQLLAALRILLVAGPAMNSFDI